MDENKYNRLRQRVRHQYAKVATGEHCGCGPGCCNAPASASATGYTEEELQAAPGTHMGLGCGNPQAIACLREGETVLDLGCGGGFDCFLAARQVGESGRVIGVDMTEEMIARARRHAETGGYGNVEFRLGEMENLPLENASVDVIISNCAINLSPDKARVIAQAWRVLKPGGRLAISDIVAIAELPASLREDEALHSSCIAGAETIARLQALLRETGFEQVRITPHKESQSFIRDWAPGVPVMDYVVAASIEAIKPGK